MAANVETMFYTREKPWHGLGTMVAEAPNSKDALRLAGLNWKVLQEPVYTENEELIQGYKANVRDTDRKVLGVVTDRYKVIQNEEAFALHYWARVSVMRQPVPCRKDAVCGCLPDCQGSLSLAVSESVRIWYFPIPMTVREP